jgi:hypothetical protein
MTPPPPPALEYRKNQLIALKDTHIFCAQKIDEFCLCETGFGRILEAAPNLSGYQGSSLKGFITMVVVKTQKKWF